VSRHVLQLSKKYGQIEDRIDKTVFALSLVKTLQEQGRRFLQRMDDHWAIVEDQIASRKVAQALRIFRRKSKP
jgi:hypothetical protein